uniref:CRAL-TRIO domain-containing protein n=1 Tax=Globodera pallida TaxID=36090 RepID=A0A183BWC9_GLOPA
MVMVHDNMALIFGSFYLTLRKERSVDDKTEAKDGITPPVTTPMAAGVAAVATGPIRIATAPHRKVLSANNVKKVPTMNAAGAVLSPAAASAIRPEIARSGGTPSGFLHSTKDAAGITEKLQMDASIRLIDDELQLIDALKDFLIETNTKYSVIGALGAQGMLAGNNPADMYRQYFFRPAAREAVEACRYQTAKISVLSIVRRFLKISAVPITLQLLLMLSSVCHTVILCIDWFIDLAVVRRLMRTELFLPILFPQSDARRVNLVVLHQRAKVHDLEPLLVRERMRTLGTIFEASIFDVNGGLTMAKLGFANYEQICADSDVNYILLGELKPRTRMDEYEQHMRNQDDYGTVLTKLRQKIYQLPNHHSTYRGKTEAQWFAELTDTWKRIREELPMLTEDGCTLKRQPTTTALSSNCTSAAVVVATDRTAAACELSRGRPRGRSRRGGDWDGNASGSRGEDAMASAGSEEVGVESDEQRTAGGETGGQLQQKRMRRGSGALSERLRTGQPLLRKSSCTPDHDGGEREQD